MNNFSKNKKPQTFKSVGFRKSQTIEMFAPQAYSQKECLRRRHTRKKVVATVSRPGARLQANRQAERAFLRKRRNDEAYD